MDTTLTYITDGHHVTAGGLVQGWGVPAVANAMVPKASGKIDDVLRRVGWDTASNVGDNAVRKFVADRTADFGNGVTAYSTAPMTYSEKYESFKSDEEKRTDAVGWQLQDVLNAGFKESVKGGLSSSSHVQSLKAPSFNGWAGFAGDSLFTGVAAPVSGEVVELGKQATGKVLSDGKE